MSNWTPVLIAIGSNIERERNLPGAVEALEKQPQIKLRAMSPVYESIPVGTSAYQPSFFNAAAFIETDLSPVALKEVLLSIEDSLGRVRTADRYAPRTIDLDIALYGQQIFELNGRHIPDPDVAKFAHVALPLADLAPDWVHPELGLTLAEITEGLHFSDKEIRKL